MDSPTTPCSLTPHQAIMKCPWQWRMPFLDEKLASRKRRVGDGYFYDPVDPSFVDHLLPGHAKRFCSAPDERDTIQREIERLATRKEQLHAASMLYDALLLVGDKAAAAEEEEDGGEALVEGLLRVSQAVAADDEAALLASPKSVASSSSSSSSSPSSEDEDESDEDEGPGPVAGSLELELVSDNLQDELFAEDGSLLDFQHARD